MNAHVLIVSTAHGEGSGAAAVLDYLLEAWSSQRVEITLAMPRDARGFATAVRKGISILPFNTPHDALKHNLAASVSLIRRARSRPVDIVHAWHSRGLELGLLLSLALHAKPTATLHDHPLARAHSQMRQRMMRHAVNRMKAVACVSQATANAWTELGASAPTRVVYNGVTEITPPPPECEPPVIGFLGAYSPVKGFYILRDWLDQLSEQPWHCHIYGQPCAALREDIAKLEARYPGRVILRGQQARATIYREISMLVNPSTYFDPLPTTLLEAAASGLPALASSLGGSTEIVVHGETGFVYDGDQPERGATLLGQLLADANLRKQLGRAARTRFEKHFTMQQMVAGYEAFWLTAMDEVSP